MLILYLEMFLCEEDQSIQHVLDIKCASSTHQVLFAVSTVLLIVFLGFILLQKVLYTTRSFNFAWSEVPWASLSQNRVDLWKHIIKVFLAFAFIFDKSANAWGFIQLIVSFIFVWILFNRLRTAIVNSESVYPALIIYDTMLAWLFLTLGIDNIIGGESDITIMQGIIMMIVGFCLGMSLYLVKQ